MSFFRYCGGKGKLQKTLIHRLQKMVSVIYEYREPFYGGGGFGVDYLEANTSNLLNVWINDKDVGIACLHTSVVQFPMELCERINNYLKNWDKLPESEKMIIRLEKAKSFKDLQNECASWTEMPETADEIINYGLKKLVVHQMSYSGLGIKSGGPLGGISQQSKYPIDCRWSPKSMIKKINKISELYSNFKIRENSCTNRDFADLILNDDYPAVLYLDPPYYDKGNDLYHKAFDENAHIRLRDTLRLCKYPFLLSYDDCPQIRELYKDHFCVEKIPVKCSITATKQTDEDGNITRIPLTKFELLIVPSEYCEVLSDLKELREKSPEN